MTSRIGKFINIQITLKLNKCQDMESFQAILYPQPMFNKLTNSYIEVEYMWLHMWFNFMIKDGQCPAVQHTDYTTCSRFKCQEDSIRTSFSMLHLPQRTVEP